MDLNLRNFPDELAKELKVEAAASGMTLKELVVLKCARKGVVNEGTGREDNSDHARGVGGGEAEATGRGRDGTAVSVLQSSKGNKKRLHPVQPVRGKLAERGGHNEGPEAAESVKVVNGVCPVDEKHRFYRNGESWWCSDCKKSYPS